MTWAASILGRRIGWVMLATLIGYLLSALFPALLPLPVLCAWLVPLVLWKSLGTATRRQTLFLLSLGGAGIVYGLSKGLSAGWQAVFAVNVPLLAMFVAVSFLSLTAPREEEAGLPTGLGAVLRTALGTHLLGALINLSVLFVFGDRLQKKGRLEPVQEILLARSFCAAAWWSPFFIATGVALVYAPQMQWRQTIVPGALMSMAAIAVTCLEAALRSKREFHGYPLKGESLTLPLVLAAAVITGHSLLPHLSILKIICCVAPVAAVLFMKGRPRGEVIADFVDNRMASVANQFALFLAAGVFSAGLRLVLRHHDQLFAMSAQTFTPLAFTAFLGVMIVAGIFGVHPIISIAVVSPMLLPLQPDHSQLGFLFLSSWAISTACSPLSGVGLTLVSRYNAPPWEILRNNVHYAALMWAAASLLNRLFF